MTNAYTVTIDIPINIVYDAKPDITCSTLVEIRYVQHHNSGEDTETVEEIRANVEYALQRLFEEVMSR